MAVDNPNVIDFVSTNLKGQVSLTISDHLEWDNNENHLSLLQDKLNAYLEFIESGQLWEQYPGSIGRQIVIRVVAQYEPNESGREFILKVKELLRDEYAYQFLFQVSPME